MILKKRTAKKSVVIVEDEFHIANAQRLILEKDFNVFIASDGEEGLKKIKEIKPHLVILDIMLPKLDGYNVCKQVREDKELSNTKIIMVTAKDQQKDEFQGMEFGADDYICKPFEDVELLHVISQVLNSKE